MIIYVHTTAYQVDENTSVFDFVTLILKRECTGIALAINENIIPINKWESTYLNENDKLLIIKAVAGG